MKEILIYAVKVDNLYLKKTWSDYGAARCEAERQVKKNPDSIVTIECADFNIDGSRMKEIWDNR